MAIIKTHASTEDILTGLNPEQVKAVTHNNGPLLIIAGAGTGKTSVITRRIAYLIASKSAKPGEILALTFTDKAANEMESRVDVLVPYGYIDVAISTFHSFGDRVLRDHAIDLGLRPDYRVLSHADQIVFFREHWHDFPLKHFKSLSDPLRHIEALVKVISRAKDEDISPELYLQWAKRQKRKGTNGLGDEAKKHLEIALIYKKYQDLKMEKGFVDFGDQVNLALKLFREHPQILKKYQDRYKYILIDEFQDTNLAQFELLQLLAKKSGNITVVGDDDQCLPPNSIIDTLYGKKKIKNIMIGEEVATSVGRGHLSYSRVNKVIKNKKNARFITFITESGKKLTVTSNHKLFCMVPSAHIAKKSFYYVYLMFRQDIGWRIGITNDLITRLKLERSADKILGIKGFKSESEARYYEELWSLKYGIPTACFKSREGISLNEKLLKRLYKEINSDFGVLKLAADLGINLDSHHFCLSAVDRGRKTRIKINLEMCYRKYRSKAARTVLKNPAISHILYMETSNGRIKNILEKNGIPFTKSKKGLRIRIQSADIEKLGYYAQKLKSLTSGIIEVKLKAGKINKMTLPALVMPASNVLLGQYLPVRHGSCVVYERVVDLRSDEKNLYVYDLEVEKTHNFVADGFIVHNSIYKFRGAAISNILGFEKKYKKCKKVVLVSNYRSTQLILDTSYRLIKHNNPDRLEVKSKINKKLLAVSLEPIKNVEHKHFDTVLSEADWVAKHIKEKVDNGENKLKDFAILVRSNSTATPFCQSLNLLGIPYLFSGGGGLYVLPEVRIAVSFLRAISDLADNVSLYELAISMIYNLNPLDMQKINTYAKRRNVTIHHVFSKADQIRVPGSELFVLADIKDATIEKIQKIMKDIEYYIEFAKSHSTGEVLYHFLKKSKFLESLTTLESIENDNKLKNLAKFFGKVREFHEIIDNDRVSEFVKYLNLLKEAGEDPESSQPDFDVDAVSILTIHKAKGLEFPVVFMVSLVSEKFPTRARSEAIALPQSLIKEIIPSGGFHLQEERRLFYVGMTRAKSQLYFTSAVDYGGKRERKTSQFVLEALDLPKAAITPTKKKPIEQIELFAPQEVALLPIKRFAKDEVLSLSYYPIDDYLTCPLKYKYVHILNVPLLPTHTIMYGSALHKAVQSYYSAKMNNQKFSEKELLDIFMNNWSSEGFISRQHEEARLLAGKEALKRFYKEQKKSKHEVKFVEEEFKIVKDRIQIKGRWDLVLNKRISNIDSQISIIDFKSTEVKTQEDADKRAKDSIQLAIYAMAWREMFGHLPDLVQLHFLDNGIIGSTEKTQKELDKTWEKIMKVASSIRSADFRATPSSMKCGYCPYSEICPASIS